MPLQDELRSILSAIIADGMTVHAVRIAASDVMYFKAILEAYPGVGSVHAPRRNAASTNLLHQDGVTLAASGAKTASGSKRQGRVILLYVATTIGFDQQLSEILEELQRETSMEILHQPSDSCESISS